MIFIVICNLLANGSGLPDRKLSNTIDDEIRLLKKQHEYYHSLLAEKENYEYRIIMDNLTNRIHELQKEKDRLSRNI